MLEDMSQTCLFIEEEGFDFWAIVQALYDFGDVKAGFYVQIDEGFCGIIETIRAFFFKLSTIS